MLGNGRKAMKFIMEDPILSPIYGKDEVYGTYIHGIFENGEFNESLLNNLRKRKNTGRKKRRKITENLRTCSMRHWQKTLRSI